MEDQLKISSKILMAIDTFNVSIGAISIIIGAISLSKPIGSDLLVTNGEGDPEGWTRKQPIDTTNEIYYPYSGATEV